MTSAPREPTIYRAVIDDVIASIKPEFDEYGVSEDVLHDLQDVSTPSSSYPTLAICSLQRWEKKVIAQVEEKREVELHYYKKKQWIGQVNTIVR